MRKMRGAIPPHLTHLINAFDGANVVKRLI
jgi:hypothetical protein